MRKKMVDYFVAKAAKMSLVQFVQEILLEEEIAKHITTMYSTSV